MRFSVVASLACAGLAQESPFWPYLFGPSAPGLTRFRASRFGLFIHWGPCSQWGSEISFPLTCGALPCTSQGANGTHITINTTEELAAHRAAYTALAQTFNPTQFNATLMADLAWNAGFRYMTWVATHCDGFSNWNSTVNKNYSITTTPYGRDTFGLAREAFSARGLRVGAYVCPSFWNNDNYFWPSAATALGTCCQPTYNPAEQPAAWAAFVGYLHEQITEIATRYAPYQWFFDSGTYAPAIDTHIEQAIPAIRAANPEAVVQVRDGGVWRDFIETDDHSETEVDTLLGVSYLRPGDAWEVPGTLGEQWAYDPHATYKDAPTVIRTLIPVVAKGGNWLLNIGPDSTGQWAPAAVETLQNMALWFAFNAEAIHNVSAFYPYDFYNGPISSNNDMPFRQLFTQSLVRNSTYIYLLPPANPFPVTPTSLVIVPVFKPSTLVAPPASMSLLTATGDKSIAFALNESGLSFPAGDVLTPAPLPLLTYFKNYTTGSRRGYRRHDPRISPKDALMPAPGRRLQRNNSGEASRRGATGSVPYARVAVTSSSSSLSDPPSMVDRAPCGLRGCSVYTTADYVLVRAEGTCYATSLLPGGAAATPVILWYNGADDNLGAANAPADGQTWSDVDTECWAYAAQNADSTLLPLELWHSASYGEYWTLADPASRAEAVVEGYERVSTLGYVDPASGSARRSGDPDPAVVASWAYVLRVDW